MHTLFDFISNVNAVQYVIALLSILGFIIFSEVLKANPFEGLREAVAEDVRFIKTPDKGTRLQLIKNVALAPFYFLSYLASLPVLFVQGMAEADRPRVRRNDNRRMEPGTRVFCRPQEGE